jgi:hypothetical protein
MRVLFSVALNLFVNHFIVFVYEKVRTCEKVLVRLQTVYVFEACLEFACRRSYFRLNKTSTLSVVKNLVRVCIYNRRARRCPAP